MEKFNNKQFKAKYDKQCARRWYL